MACIRGTQPRTSLGLPVPERAQDFPGNWSPRERPELPCLTQALGFHGNWGFLFCPCWEENASGRRALGQGPRCRLSAPRGGLLGCLPQPEPPLCALERSPVPTGAHGGPYLNPWSGELGRRQRYWCQAEDRWVCGAGRGWKGRCMCTFQDPSTPRTTQAPWK